MHHFLSNSISLPVSNTVDNVNAANTITTAADESILAKELDTPPTSDSLASTGAQTTPVIITATLALIIAAALQGYVEVTRKH